MQLPHTSRGRDKSACSLIAFADDVGANQAGQSWRTLKCPQFTRSGHRPSAPSTEGQSQRERSMKQGDHVKIMGIAGFYVFLKEVQGTATLRVGSANGPDQPTIAIAIDRVVSLEKAN
jgi:hypothetical protein